MKLLNITEITENEMDILYKSGCNDGIIFSVDSEIFIQFNRTATSRYKAVKSAKMDIEKAGFETKFVKIFTSWKIKNNLFI